VARRRLIVLHIVFIVNYAIVALECLLCYENCGKCQLQLNNWTPKAFLTACQALFASFH